MSWIKNISEWMKGNFPVSCTKPSCAILFIRKIPHARCPHCNEELVDEYALTDEDTE